MTTALETIAPLQTALALATEAGDITQLRDVRAMSTALQKGAKARGMGVEAENAAAEVVLRAERAIGQLLTSMRESGALQGEGRRSNIRREEGVLTLPDLGFNPHDQSLWKWQQLARMPEDDFEDMLSIVKQARERISKQNFYRGASPRSDGARPDDGASSLVYASFRRGIRKMLTVGLGSLPNDELAETAGLIRELFTAYNAARETRV